MMVTVTGNLTADPELRYTQNGLPVANWTIAQTEKVWDRTEGKAKDGDSLYMRCSVWREFAEHVAASLTKGMRVIAYGALKQRAYQDREGNQRTAIELAVEWIGPDLRFATAQVTRATDGAKSGTDWDSVNSGSQQRQQPPAQHAASAWTTAPAGGGSFGDDTPF